MIQNIFLTSFFLTLLVFTGCNTDTTAEENLKSQQMLDDGDFEGVIDSLSSKSDRSARDNVTLGSAYMSAVDLSFSDLSLMISNIDSSNKATSRNLQRQDSDSYAEFANKIQENVQKNPKVLEYLQNAIESFEAVDQNMTDENVDLLLGTAQTAQATSVFSYLGDMSKLLEYGVDYELLASSCAMYHTSLYSNVELMSNLTDDCVESRILETSSGDGYKELLVTLSNGMNYKRLITLDAKSVILTDGYIGEDGNNTYNSGNGLNLPYIVEDVDFTIKEALVITLNDGFENLLLAAPEDIWDDIQSFRTEIDFDNDLTITSEELSAYIETQIKK